MTEPPRSAAIQERLALIDGLVYADGFDCAVTMEELWRYSGRPVARDELQRHVRQDPALAKLIVERDGLYCLADRCELLDRRPARIAKARRLRRRVRWVARVLRHVPFVRGLLLTGSAAADDAHPRADADVLVVVAPGRLGMVFLILGSISTVQRRRLFCPNFYLSDDHLDLSPPTLYAAHEIAQAIALVGGTQRLLKANPWVRDLLPNAVSATSSDTGLARGTRMQRMLEMPLRGRVGDRLERYARRLASRRLLVHHRGLGAQIPPHVAASLATGAALRFHGGGRHEDALLRHATLQHRLARELQGILASEPPAA